ncbi:hypothetical protein [Hyphomicrobium denitrificans]|nr:hypothetical protein [Hyphomicrobium denitrificans]
MRHTVFTSAVLTLLAASPACLADPIDPAQAIAQKFYEADQLAPTQPLQMPKPPRVAKPDPDGPGLDYEMDMLRRARAEEAERQKDITATAPITVAQPAPAAAPQPVAEPIPTALPEPIARAIEPPASAPMPIAQPLKTAVAQATEPDRAVPASGTRATILLVLDPDDTDQAHVKPDPIICFDQQCWISNGLDSPAKPMPRSEAVALKTTETTTGDSCSGKSGCAFRNVAFHPDSQIQVVEVGESRGVADGAYTVAADATCRKLDGDLMCDNALVTHAFRMWVVPETTAQQVGPSTLEDAVANGLQDNEDDNAADGK